MHPVLTQSMLLLAGTSVGATALVGAGLCVVVAVLYIVARRLGLLESPSRGAGRGSKEIPAYGLKDSLLTRGEAAFYTVLREAVGPRYAIMVKVRLEDVLIMPQMERGDEDARSKHWSARGFVKSRHLDFLLCDPATLRPMLAIELDDASHQSQAARHGDDVKNKALQSAGLPLLRVRASGQYKADDVRLALTRSMAPASPTATLNAAQKAAQQAARP